MASQLTQLVKARVDPKMKQEVEAERRRLLISEGALVRIALREYLNKQKGRR